MTLTQRRVVDHALDGIVGVSPWARHIHEEIRCVADHESTVLISGPSGTGKELIARAIHTHGRRAGKPFIPVNCAAITGTLFESHMFGHLEGAFTGANYTAQGCFRAAEAGTIFLDEIGELSFDLQAKLLRVLQERAVVPVGSHEELPVDVRVIAATNRDLKQEVAAGRFRQDLFYRINIFSLRAAPLSERLQDIEVLTNHLLARLSIRGGVSLKRISDKAMRLLTASPWPGNVRELENVLERATVYTPGDVIEESSFPELLAGKPTDSNQHLPPNRLRQTSAESLHGDDHTYPNDRAEPCVEADGHWLTMGEIEREHIRKTLQHTFYNQSAAARLLQMDRHLLRRKIKKYDLDVSRSTRGRPRTR